MGALDMSLINQVLNQLEHRGAHTAPDQTLVRAVPMQGEHGWGKSVVIAAAVICVILLIVWLFMQHQNKSVEQTPVKQLVVVGDVVIPLSGVSAAIPEVSMLPAGKLSYELSAVNLRETIREISKTETTEQEREQPNTTVASKKSVAIMPKIAEPKQTLSSSPSATILPLKQVSRSQQADAEYRKATMLQQQGHVAEALAGYESGLKLSAQHDAARLALAALLLENNRSADAERVLQDGLKIKPNQTAFSMTLARMQVARGNMAQALESLQKNLPQADDKPEYQAFYAALLQREGRHKEAVNHYQIALQLAPRNGVWLMGYGISLQAAERIEDARSAYQQALATQTLSPALTAFVQEKLKGL